MNFGLIFANAGPFTEPEALAHLARSSEAAGIESLWSVEHVVIPVGYKAEYPYDKSGKIPGGEKMPVPDPIIPLAFAAAVTENIWGDGGRGRSRSAPRSTSIQPSPIDYTWPTSPATEFYDFVGLISGGSSGTARGARDESTCAISPRRTSRRAAVSRVSTATFSETRRRARRAPRETGTGASPRSARRRFRLSSASEPRRRFRHGERGSKNATEQAHARGVRRRDDHAAVAARDA